MLSEFEFNGRKHLVHMVLLLDGDYFFRLLARCDDAGHWERLGGSGLAALPETKAIRAIEQGERWKIPLEEAYWPSWEFDVAPKAREVRQEKIPARPEFKAKPVCETHELPCCQQGEKNVFDSLCH